MDIRLATFKSLQEFQHLYLRVKEEPKEPDPNAAEEKESEGAELKLFSEVHLMIFALDTIDERSNSWIDKMRLNMRKFKRFPESGEPMRLVMLKYEDDNISKLDVMHP